MKKRQSVVEQLALKPHPEGGFYREIYRSETVSKMEDGRKRAWMTSIYYYLTGDNFSAWHRLRADEIWHFYSGSSVTLHVIDKSGELVHFLLGNPAENVNCKPQIVIPQGVWFAAEVDCDNAYSLVGATVSPGFEFEDFELAKSAALIADFPQHEAIIKRLTRA